MSGPALSDPSASATETAGVNGHPAAPRGVVLSLWLRTSDSSGSPAAVSWPSESRAAALAVDILTASGGSPDAAQGVVLPSRFFNAQSALLAARRLQWALEGLAESDRSSTTASMAIYPAEDPAAGSIAPALGDLPSGQVLLSAQFAEVVHQVPGVAVSAAGSSGWCALQWHSQNGPTSLAGDEQSVLGLIRALGREDPCPPRPEPAATGEVAAATPVGSGAFEVPAALGRSLMESETAPPLWKKPWILVSAAAAVVVLIAALVIPAMISGNRTKSPAEVTTPKPAAPQPASPGAPQSVAPNGSVPAAPERAREPKPAAKVVKQPRTESKATPGTEPAPQAKPPAGSCDLTEGEIPRSLSRAESLMYAGKLEAAQDAYQRLIGCPLARDKAAEGLRLVKLRIAAQSSSVP